MGRAGLADHRSRAARPRELEVAEGGSRRPGPARLHAERRQQDAGRAVQPAPGAGCAGLGPDHLGGARRPRIAAGPLDDPHRPRPHRGARRPLPRGARPQPGPSAVALRCAARDGRVVAGRAVGPSRGGPDCPRGRPHTVWALAQGAMTTRRSPPSTCWWAPMATRDTVPPVGEVMFASIFIASIVATTPPASTVSPSATLSVTTPAKGAATWPAEPASAFSADFTSASIPRSRT